MKEFPQSIRIWGKELPYVMGHNRIIFTELQTGKNSIACDSFTLLNLEICGNSISWYGVFSVKKLRIDGVFYVFLCVFFFCFRFRTNIFPFPVDIFSEKQKFCSSFICKLGGPFIKLSSFISILYKKFILISLFQSFNSVFPWGWIQSSRLTRYKCPCTCLDSRTQLDNMPTEY